MATKRKKSGELWLSTSKSDSLGDQLSSSDKTLLPKYIELKQRIELLEEEKDKNLKKLKQLEQTIREADCKCANHLAQLSELKEMVGELEIKLEKKNEQYNQVIKQLEENKQYYVKQEEKWQIFQKDLLTTVRVANDLKTEAEEQSDLLLNENKTLTERIASLENELSGLQMNKKCANKNDQQKNDEKIELKDNLEDDLKRNSMSDKDSSLKCNSMDNDHDSILFRKTDVQSTKRNLNCFNDLQNNSIIDKNKLIRQQSADSVFSTSSTISLKDKNQLLNQRNSTQSLTLSGQKNKISVKSLVETIESKTMGSNGSCNSSQQQISKSPSFNSINLNNKSEDCRSTPKSNYLHQNGKIEINNKFNHQMKSDNVKLENNKNDYDMLISNKIGTSFNNATTSTPSTTTTVSRLLTGNVINSKKENCPINLNNNEHNATNGLNNLIKDGGSIRNGLLRWCQKKVQNYPGIEISNFSSSWKDSLVICALLHSLDHTLIPFHTLDRNNKKKNFQLAFKAAQSIGIQCNLNIEDLINEERPDWSQILAYVTAIYSHFENNNKTH